MLMFSSLFLGVAHAFELDHLTAVSTFVSTKPAPRKAFRFGLQWGLGHGLSLVLFGMVLYALKLQLSPETASLLERFVGLALFIAGVYSLWKLRNSEVIHHHHHHKPRSAFGSFWMGVMHGLAGTAAFLGQAFIALSQSFWSVLAYSMLFSGGVLVSMCLYSTFFGWLIEKGSNRFHFISKTTQAMTGVFSMSLGVFWLVK
jgi:cytochrome c biogenesis protein CcdA